MTTRPIASWNPAIQVGLTPIQQLQRNGYACGLRDPFRDPRAEILAREGNATTLAILSLVNSRAYPAGPGVARSSEFIPFTLSAASTPSAVTAPRSLVAERFARELIELLCPKEGSGPLVMEHQQGVLRFVYRSDTAVELTDYAHGIDFSDTGWGESVTLDTACVRVAADRGNWRFNRSPLEVPRAELPEWDKAVAKQLRKLVDRCVAAGELTILQSRLERVAISADAP